MSMTRKDYVMIAKALVAVEPVAEDYQSVNDWTLARLQWGRTVVAMTNTFIHDNHDFDHNRFYDACNYGVPSNGIITEGN